MRRLNTTRLRHLMREMQLRFHGAQPLTGKEIEKMRDTIYALPGYCEKQKDDIWMRIVEGPLIESPYREQKKARGPVNQKRPVELLDAAGNVLRTYPSIASAANALKVDRRTVIRICEKKRTNTQLNLRYKNKRR